mgnify:CR=1 FL=1
MNTGEVSSSDLPMKTLTWREALLAMAADARIRAENSKPMPGGPADWAAEAKGARYAFSVMACEMEHLATHYDRHEALTRLRKLLAKKSVIMTETVLRKATIVEDEGK